MTKKSIVSVFVFGAMAFAASNRFKVDLSKNSVIDGKPIKAGVYELSMANGYAVFRQGRYSIEIPAHEEKEATKVDGNELLYDNKTELKAIYFGGTNTAILFGVPAAPDRATGEVSSLH